MGCRGCRDKSVRALRSVRGVTWGDWEIYFAKDLYTKQGLLMQDGFPHIKLTDAVAAAPQLQPEDMPAVAAAGYRVLINNRPDGEEPHQPSSDMIRAAAEGAGLDYHYYPLNAFNYPGDDLAAMGRLFDDTENPVLAFCRSGTRSTSLWISSRQDADKEGAREHARQLGFDVSMSLN
jgi:uncharacterized protein (TIGR01244 family)